MRLPARVRVSRLQGLPSPTVLASLRRIQDHSLLAATQSTQSPPDVLCVAIAGGKVIGYLARAGDEEVLALEAAWRGRGIEDALRREA